MENVLQFEFQRIDCQESFSSHNWEKILTAVRRMLEHSELPCLARAALFQVLNGSTLVLTRVVL